MECIICAYKFNSFDRIPALTECDHNNVCGFCYLRMRALQKNYSCPTCKKDLEHVICTDKKDAVYRDFTIWGDSIGEDYMLDQKSRMFIPKKFSKSTVEPLWLCKCNSCPQTRRDLKSLKGHLAAEHNLHLCMLCVENKQAFPSEQKIYTQAQYEKHLRKGDGDGSNGHPNCEFCRKRFYDSIALFTHLNKDHYTCHLCERAGIKFKYYSNYKDLESHYRRDHILCEERACLEKQFIAFANEIDFAAHNMMWHPSLQAAARTSRRSAIPVTFKPRRNEQSSSNRAEGGADGGEPSQDRSGFEGGLGGRAVDGEWQVRLQPVSGGGDPRDPLRNTHSGMGVESFVAPVVDAASGEPSEEFPALQSSSASAPVGSFYSGLVTNKWVGIGGSNGEARIGGKKKSDFPALGGSAARGKLSAADRHKLGLPAKNKGQASSSSSSSGNVSSIDAEYASAASAVAASSRANPLGGALSNLGKVKVDKRLLAAHTKKPALAAAATSSSSDAHRGSSAASDQEGLDLALALSASMAATTTPTAPVAAAPPASWVKVEPKAAAPSYSFQPPPAPLTSEEAFPGLAATALKPTSSLSSSAAAAVPKRKKMAAPAVNKNLLDMTSMLRAAGVSGTGTAPKRGPKLTVVKLQQPAPIPATAVSINWAAPPPPPVSVSSLTRIGKSSNDNLAGLAGADVYKAAGSGKLSPTGPAGFTATATSTSTSNKTYGGWVKMGGAGDSTDISKNPPSAAGSSAAAQTAVSSDDFPSLGGKSSNSKSSRTK